MQNMIPICEGIVDGNCQFWMVLKFEISLAFYHYHGPCLWGCAWGVKHLYLKCMFQFLRLSSPFIQSKEQTKKGEASFFTKARCNHQCTGNQHSQYWSRAWFWTERRAVEMHGDEQDLQGMKLEWCLFRCCNACTWTRCHPFKTLPILEITSHLRAKNICSPNYLSSKVPKRVGKVVFFRAG